MIPFAIRVPKIDGDDSPRGYWVLTVQGNRFLIAIDGRFQWVKMEDASLQAMVRPDGPRPVVIVGQGEMKQPAPMERAPKLLIPSGIDMRGA